MGKVFRVMSSFTAFFTVVILLLLTRLHADPVLEWKTKEAPASSSLPQTLQTIQEGQGLPQEQLTIEAWVQIDKPIRWGGILSAIQDNGSYERGWLLGYENNQFSFALASAKIKRLTYLKSKQSYLPGVWYHVAVTYDGKEQKIYMDGQLSAASKKQSGPIFYPPELKLVVGAYHDSNEHYPLSGKVDQVTLWDEALEAADILRHFNEQKAKFPGAAPEPEISALAGDWPTYMHNNSRSGRTSATLQFPLHLQWSREMDHPPNPAWPPPAKQDFWHNKYNLQPRVTYDRTFHLIGNGKRAYFGSSADDQVRCIDLNTGKTLWTFFADAPVRLAPTLTEDRLLFGADDGFAYCLEAATGKLLWKTKANPNPPRWIPGNNRLISSWPVRSSILVDGPAAYLCSGLFPNQGAWHLALDLRNGNILDQKPIQFSPQGYLAQRGNQFLIPTGRDLRGRQLSASQRRSKRKANHTPVTPTREFSYAAISTTTHRILGGDSQIAAESLDSGKIIWSQEVSGNAYGLAIIGGQLLVSTDNGTLLCFGPDKRKPRHIEREIPPNITQPPHSHVAKATTSLTNRKGYALVLGATNTQLLRNLANATDFQVIAVVGEPDQVQPLRKDLAKHLVYGTRITVLHFPTEQPLPFTDYLFNCILEDPNGQQAPDVWLQQIPQLIHPTNGIFIDQSGKATSGQALEGAGEWTHIYANPANTACSLDSRTSGSLQLQWFGLPGPEKMLDRHHRSIPPLWKNGRLFVPGNERVYGVDAYNGTVLWEKETPGSRRVGIFRDCGSMAASSEALYVAANDKCNSIDTETGKTRQTYQVRQVGNQPAHWGLVAHVGDKLLGSSTRPGASRKTHDMATIREGTYWDNRPAVTSISLFAMDRHDGGHIWQYAPKNGALLNPSFTFAEGKAFFLESRNPQTLKIENGRANYTQFVESHGADLVALDLETGKETWRQPLEFPKEVQNSSLLCAQGRVILQYSRNEKTVRYDVRTFDAASGNLLWETSQDNRNRPGGDHGEQDHHPVAIGNKLIIEPFAYNLKSGQRLPQYDLRRHGHGCGTMSASASSLYFRAGNPTEYLLGQQKLRKITTVSRPGCWINIIPAGGLILIPEASSGCTCNFAVQASMAFLPTGE